MVEAGALHELTQRHLLALKVTLEYCELALEDLIFVLSASLQLSNSNLKFGVHVIPLLLSIFLLLIKQGLLLLNILQAFLNVLKATLCVVVAHQIVAVVCDLLL